MFATLNEFRAYLRIPIPETEPETPSEEDLLMTSILTAASDTIARAANRTFELMDETPTPEARTFELHAHRGSSRRVRMDDTFDEVADITVTGIDGEVRLAPFAAPRRGRAYDTIIVDRSTAAFPSWGYSYLSPAFVTVTARWGWPAIPEAIRSATLLQAARWYKRRDAPFGVIGSADMGSIVRLLAQVDPDVYVLIANYKKWWV